MEDALRFFEFTKRYGRHAAVDRVSFDVGAGEAVALLGPNGSGKTTTLKAAAGLVHPTSGAVLVGAAGRPSHEAAARAECSFLPQRVAFPEALTGREIVEFYRRLRKGSVASADRALQLAALNGASGRTVATYSGGMVQRLGLAVAVLAEPRILLLDEPTAALDPAGLDGFYVLVEQMKAQGRTVLFTSHQLGDAEQLADRFVVLVEGRLAAVLTRDELAARIPAGRTRRLHALYRELTEGE